MPISYRNIQQYEKEILRMRVEELTRRETGEKLGLSKDQITVAGLYFYKN